MSLSTQPYKGARDFYPEDKRLQKYLFSVWRSVVERFGYEEYNAPILEHLDIYLAKTGDEIVNEQTYVFEDRGGRKVVIRPEMTPSISRLVAKKRQELAYPLRWYSIPNLWRYERPQRGRLREHWQLNVDLFGIKDTKAELEIVTLVDAIFKAFKANSEMYEIHINHRGLVNFLLTDIVKLSTKSRLNVSRLIDRKQKMEKTTFLSKLDEALTPAERESGVAEKLLAILEAHDLSELPPSVKDNDSYKELASLFNDVKQQGLHHAIYDPSLMRGFDYYTGIVFEVFDKDPTNNRSMMGGGRYDGLVGLFGVDPVPTVGFGWGDVTLVNFLETHHLLPDLKPETDVYVALVGDILKEAQPVISKLRSEGVNVAVDFSRKKLGDQLKSADKKGLEDVLIIGDNEISSGNFKLKNLKSGSEQTIETDKLAQAIKAKQDNK